MYFVPGHVRLSREVNPYNIVRKSFLYLKNLKLDLN